jgi:hypothetical protein
MVTKTFSYIWNGSGRVYLSSKNCELSDLLFVGDVTIRNINEYFYLILYNPSGPYPPIELTQFLRSHINNYLQITGNFSSQAHLIKVGGAEDPAAR